MKNIKLLFALFLLIAPAMAFADTGGTITTDGNYVIHTFTSNGTYTPSENRTVEVLVVAGGGGGGKEAGGGGGGGGVVYNSSIAVTTQGYTITIGDGGTGSTSRNVRGTNGQDSTFASLVNATGGGGGGSANSINGGNGAAGGGEGWVTGSPGTGSNGGDGGETYWSNPYSYGGGGGGGVNGTDGIDGISIEHGGNGGNGTGYSINGSYTYYGGGGGGGGDTIGTGAQAIGGLGGGGVGGFNADNGQAGTDGLGGGGGGGGSLSTTHYDGHDGGSGVVIIRYLNASDPYTHIKLQDVYDNANLEGINVTLTNGVSNLTQSDGIAYFYNQTTLNFTAYDPSGLYFNYTSTTTPTENSTTTYEIYGAFPGIQAYDVEGSSIISFNITNAYYTNSTSTGTAYTYFAPNSTNEPVNLTSANYYLYEGSINTTGQDTSTKNISGLYQSVITVNATNAYTGEVLNNYTGWIYNEDTGYNQTFNTTGNQTTLYAVEGNHTVFIDVPGYSISSNNYDNQNYTALNNYTITFNLYSENSVNVNIYKEEDASPILENITVLVEGSSSSDTFYTNTSNLFIEGLSDGNYTFKLSGVNWTQRSYIVTVADRSTQNLNTYLSNASDTVTFTNLDFDTSQPIEAVAMYQQRLINNTWTTIESKYTDITGKTQFTHDLNVKYRFTAEKETYESKVFDLDPIIYTSYTIRLQKSLTVDTNNGLFDVSLVYYPKYFTNEANNTFTFTFGSVGGSLQTYGYLLTYPGGTQGSSGSSANGETFNTGNFTVTGAVYGDYANLTYWYDSTLGSNKTYSAQIPIQNITNNNALQDNANNDYGLGVLDKLLIATIVIILFAGVLTLFGSAEFGMLGGMIALGIFTYIEFVSLWAAIPVFIVGVLLLLRGRV